MCVIISPWFHRMLDQNRTKTLTPAGLTTGKCSTSPNRRFKGRPSFSVGGLGVSGCLCISVPPSWWPARPAAQTGLADSGVTCRHSRLLREETDCLLLPLPLGRERGSVPQPFPPTFCYRHRLARPFLEKSKAGDPRVNQAAGCEGGKVLNRVGALAGGRTGGRC